MENLNKTYIIAEAGVNHNGSLNVARKMVAAAADAGVDAVKFQTFKAERLVTLVAPKAEYQCVVTSKGESQFEMLKKLELNFEAHQQLLDDCRQMGVDFLSTPFDLESVDLLVRLGLQTFKIPSGEITNLPLLRKIGSLKKRIILSTGMADLREIEDALGVLTIAGTAKKNITVLHCNTEYPTPMKDVNLRAMLTIKDSFSGVKIGYSDHTLGLEVSIAAVAMGAQVIEKHFTLDKNMTGPDHKASLDIDELTKLVISIRNVELTLGDGSKTPSSSEMHNKVSIRKSIVAAKRIKKGAVFTESNLAAKRPGRGISPMQWDKVLGLISLKNYEADDFIEL